MLRTAIPYQWLAALVAIVGCTVVALLHTSALLDRARLTQALFFASLARLDPALDRAMTGRWSAVLPDRTIAPQSPEGTLDTVVTAEGVALTQTRGADRVQFRLDHHYSHEATVYWRCHVRRVDTDSPAAPMSIPALCRA